MQATDDMRSACSSEHVIDSAVKNMLCAAYVNILPYLIKHNKMRRVETDNINVSPLYVEF